MRRKEAERQEEAGQRREAMGWEESAGGKCGDVAAIGGRCSDNFFPFLSPRFLYHFSYNTSKYSVATGRNISCVIIMLFEFMLVLNYISMFVSS